MRHPLYVINLSATRPELRSKLSLEEWEEARERYALALTMAFDIFARDRAATYRN